MAAFYLWKFGAPGLYFLKTCPSQIQFKDKMREVCIETVLRSLQWKASSKYLQSQRPPNMMKVLSKLKNKLK
jgi:hypothetical protein